MHLTVIEQEGVSTVNVVGKLDIENGGTFKKRIRDVIGGGAKKILLDISGITDVDSSGIGVLVALLNTARAGDGDLRLAGKFKQKVEDAFKLCGLDRVFIHYENVKDGIQQFNS